MTRLFCCDCRHFSQHPLSPSAVCFHEASRNVIGNYGAAVLMRADGAACGPEGKLFEVAPRRGFFAKLLGY